MYIYLFIYLFIYDVEPTSSNKLSCVYSKSTQWNDVPREDWEEEDDEY